MQLVTNMSGGLKVGLPECATLAESRSPEYLIFLPKVLLLLVISMENHTTCGPIKVQNVDKQKVKKKYRVF